MGGFRIGFVTGVATGFVLGTRAGRERYEQIMKAARTVAGHPVVQQAAGTLQAQATGIASTAAKKVSDGVPKAARGASKKIGERVRSARRGDAGGKDQPAHGAAANGTWPPVRPASRGQADG